MLKTNTERRRGNKGGLDYALLTLATHGQSAIGSQTGYGCDSEGGASGSAITDPGTGHPIALHHFGGVSSTPCLNSGTAFKRICADAGSLLSCALD